LTEQAAAVVNETTVAADLVTQLEYDRYTHKDPVPDWRPAKLLSNAGFRSERRTKPALLRSRAPFP
jgi:hypothetical protein